MGGGGGDHRLKRGAIRLIKIVSLWVKQLSATDVVRCILLTQRSIAQQNKEEWDWVLTFSWPPNYKNLRHELDKRTMVQNSQEYRLEVLGHSLVYSLASLTSLAPLTSLTPLLMGQWMIRWLFILYFLLFWPIVGDRFDLTSDDQRRPTMAAKGFVIVASVVRSQVDKSSESSSSSSLSSSSTSSSLSLDFLVVDWYNEKFSMTCTLVGRLSILGQRKSCGPRARPRKPDEEAETTARSRGYSFLNSQLEIKIYNSPPSRSTFYSEIAL